MAPKGPTNRRYLLLILALVMATNHVDQRILGLAMQDIKKEFLLSDTQLGLLTGLAFSLFYSVLGVPLARWADRGDRVRVLALTTAIWSAAIALCAAVTNFVQLLAIRVAVAVGEAGCIPTSQSLIASFYARDERPKAMSLFMLGAPAATLVGFLLGGWLNEYYGWRVTFLLLSIPAIVLAVLAWLTLRDPRRDAGAVEVGPVETPAPDAPSFREVVRHLATNTTFRYVLLAFTVFYFFGYGIQNWQPTFFIRSFGLKTGELGTWLALIFGVGGLIGVWVGGELAVRLAPGDESLQLKGTALAYVFFGVVSSCTYLATDHRIAFAFMALAALGASCAIAPLFSTIQTLVPAHMRAQATALIYFAANFVGLGLGPLAAGMVSDAFEALLGRESLRYTLLVMSPGYCLGGWLLWRASKTVKRDVQGAMSPVEALSPP